AHAALGDVHLEDDVALGLGDAGDDVDEALGPGLADVGVAADGHAQAALIPAVRGDVRGNAPALPAVLPMELFRRHVDGFIVVDGLVAGPELAVAPDVLLAAVDVVL